MLFRRSRWEAIPFLVLLVVSARLIIVLILANQHLEVGNDALLYHDTGTSYAWSFWAGQNWPLISWGWGTNNYALFTGCFYTLFGPHRLTIMLFNSTLAGVGSFLFLATLLERYPNAHPILKFLTVGDPSMLFWTSIHGKDPLMFFFLGLATHGIHRTMQGKRYAKIQVLIAVIGIGFIRPQIGLILVLAILVASGFYRTVATVLGSIMAIFLTSGLLNLYKETLNQLAYGGSAIAVRELNTGFDILLQVLTGIVAVLFRPFPWEGGSPALRVAATYGVVISATVILILLRCWRRERLFAAPFRRFLIANSAGLTLFMGLLAANLGTLARERVQLTSFLWLLLAAVATRPIHIALSRPAMAHLSRYSMATIRANVHERET